jgi:dienelactone hydrolase
VRIEKLTLRNTEGTVMPALLFRPDGTSTGLRLYLHEDGKQAETAPAGALETLARAGETVLAVDLRGLGEMQRGKRASGFGALQEPNWKSATLAYLLGQSLVGLRTEDILACARFASEKWNEGRPVHLTGLGETGIPALHAVALEPQLFASTRLERTLRTWTDVTSTPHTRNQQVNAVHGALRFYDLPDLVATLPADKRVLHEPVDAADQLKTK